MAQGDITSAVTAGILVAPWLVHTTSGLVYVLSESESVKEKAETVFRGSRPLTVIFGAASTFALAATLVVRGWKNL
jgi:succinate dehydrogenase/fumarate reductase cytochrome b subunit